MPPITPAEAAKQKIKAIPEAVIDVWNRLITENYDNGHVYLKQKDVVAALAEANNCTKDEVYENKWLDIEALYRKAGWIVEYDRPGYNESYDAHFDFTLKRKR